MDVADIARSTSVEFGLLVARVVTLLRGVRNWDSQPGHDELGRDRVDVEKHPGFSFCPRLAFSLLVAGVGVVLRDLCHGDGLSCDDEPKRNQVDSTSVGGGSGMVFSLLVARAFDVLLGISRRFGSGTGDALALTLANLNATTLAVFRWPSTNAT
jgi:hypothetical protein